MNAIGVKELEGNSSTLKMINLESGVYLLVVNGANGSKTTLKVIKE